MILYHLTITVTYVVALITFQHVNAFPGTEAEQMHGNTHCLLLVNGYVFPVRHARAVFIPSCGEQLKTNLVGTRL